MTTRSLRKPVYRPAGSFDEGISRIRGKRSRNRRSVSARGMLGLLLSCAVLWAVPQVALGDAALEGSNPAQWRLVWFDNPSTTAYISWSTAAEGEQHEVRLRERGEASWRTVPCRRSGQYTGSQPDVLYFHHAVLTGLSPETEYEVILLSDGQHSPMRYFKTAPDDDRPFSLLFGGDSRSDREKRREMNVMLGQLLAEGAASYDPAAEVFALVHGGDYVYDGGIFPQWSAWMSDHELTSATDGRLLPIIPARGNHDHGVLFNQVFGFEDNDEDNYYAMNLGSTLRLITLNTETSMAGDQRDWLEQELRSSRPQNRWVLAQYHRPAYPAVKQPSGAQRSFVPLFEEYNVDLVCEADGHNIKRTVPIRNGEHDETGVVYIGEGGLGVPQRTPRTGLWYLDEPGMAANGHHVQVLTFTADELRYRCVLLGGEVLDTYSRTPRE